VLLFVSPGIFAQENNPQWPSPMHDDAIYYKALFDRLEYAAGDEGHVAWEANLWMGGDYNRLMFKTEGEDNLDDEQVYSIDAVYSRLIFPYWDFQAGISSDAIDVASQQEQRFSVVVGFMGLAPYWFETDAMLYVSEDGDISSALEFEYDWLFTQRLVLQASLETLIAVQEVPEFGVAKGINFIETGLRLRYEIKREFAPYVGINYMRLLGDAADNAASEKDELAALAGVRIWF
jgi:copper resistance protein B